MSLSIPYDTNGTIVTVRDDVVGDVIIQALPATAFHEDQITIWPITNAQLEQLVVVLPSGTEFTLARAVEVLRQVGDL